MSSPKVSLLLPNLNNRPYLEERLQSIWDQTLQDWELIVVDSHSTDGAWEYFQLCAQKDKRIKIHQSKERGIYNNFNNCIKLAQGEYIYFATSDDTMSPTALAEMVEALANHPDCGLAHCKLKIIDQDNRLCNKKNWDDFFTVTYFGELINEPHVRKAPHDGVLHFSGITVYTSLTQIMIRHNLFAKIGMFCENFGSIADFEWVMRATLITDTVHVPHYLATWRFHSHQATTENMMDKAKAEGQFIQMADHAFKIAQYLNPDVIQSLDLKKLKYILEKEHFYYEYQLAGHILKKYWVLLKWFRRNSQLIHQFRLSKQAQTCFVSPKDSYGYIKEMIFCHKLENNVQQIKNTVD